GNSVEVQVLLSAPTERTVNTVLFSFYESGLERQLLANVRWTVATAAAFSAEKASPLIRTNKRGW
ncbi:MAG: hypothetical protein IJC88_04485, partial [Oscillospiraceae bacterium]|nr:hypothetical protein [Oscillospiraceae bacterium]